MVPQTQANIFICLLDHTYEVPLANIKMERQRCPEKPFILGRSGTQYVAIITKMLSSYWWAHLVESYCKESNISDTSWMRYLSSSYLIKIWLRVWRHQLANLHILKTWISLERKKKKNGKQHFSSYSTTLTGISRGMRVGSFVGDVWIFSGTTQSKNLHPPYII